MNKHITNGNEVKQYFSSRATLAALGVKVKGLQLFEPVTAEVKIAQKQVKYSPTDKLMDGLIAILSGAHGLVEINKRVCVRTGACKLLLGARDVLSSRWYKTHWMHVSRKTWRNCKGRWTSSIVALVKAISTITNNTCRSWMWS